MSDELYVENFSKKDKEPQVMTESQNLSVAQSTLTENYDLTYQMITYLDRLEREISDGYKGLGNLHFLFSKLRSNLKNHRAEEVIDLLADLEELLDLGLEF